MKVVPFLPLHLQNLELHGFQSIGIDLNDYGMILANNCDAYTGISEGKVLICAGVLRITKQRAQVWALMSKDSGSKMLSITREVNKYFDTLDIKRLETPVRHDFEAGHKWAKLLGFENEGLMKSYGDDGYDYNLYAKVTHG